MTLLISSISQLNLGQVQELNQNILYFLPNHSPPFKFLINDELTFELSSLIKAYCKIDSRCVELIILSKLWLKRKNIIGAGFFKGAHISLLIILFLQTSDPPILPKLQSNTHNAKIISNYDVWFDTESDFESTNPFTLGELFQLFLRFLNDLGKHDYLSDIRRGLILEKNCDVLYSTFSPFSGEEISQISKGSAEAQKILMILSETLELIDAGERLSKIMSVS